MPITAQLEVSDQNMTAAIEDWLKAILATEHVSALLVPRRLPMKNRIMPTLVSNPDQLDGVDPLAPAFTMNAAKLVCRLTRKPAGGLVVAVLRACEIRAFVELVKLHQGTTEELLIIGIDCLGALQNTDYAAFVDHHGPQATQRFYTRMLDGAGDAVDGFQLAPACRVCERPIPETADIIVGLIGVGAPDRIMIQARSEGGKELINALRLPPWQPPEARQAAIDDWVSQRRSRRDKMFAATAQAIGNLEKLSAYLADCVNCYNCRVACPVCYCRECVFVTDVFDHEPSQYLGWARRRGAIKMPTDTVFYHLTRLAHMSTACVGCGQCSNACPNDIPVMELFRTVAARTQAAFDYQAGCDPEAKPPLTEFREQEFEDVVGLAR